MTRAEWWIWYLGRAMDAEDAMDRLFELGEEAPASHLPVGDAVHVFQDGSVVVNPRDPMELPRLGQLTREVLQLLLVSDVRRNREVALVLLGRV